MMSSDEACSKANMETSEFQGEMDWRDKNALLQCRTKIIKDLDVRIIIDALLESRVVDECLYEKIKKEVKWKLRAFKGLFECFVSTFFQLLFCRIFLKWDIILRILRVKWLKSCLKSMNFRKCFCTSINALFLGQTRKISQTIISWTFWRFFLANNTRPN